MRNHQGIEGSGRTLRFIAPVCVVFLALAGPEGRAAGGASAAAGPPATPPEAEAFFTGQAPTLDGDVIDDPAWDDVEAITGFWQTTPREGEPATERTEVRVLYTRNVLYVGVVCFDDDPAGIIVADSRRDSSLEETDSFQLILDTYLDRQNGFVFGTNPAGIEYDGQVTDEGRGSGGGIGGGRQGSGSGGGFNLNWDGAWEVRTRTGNFGWSAEFAIPFSTLRFSNEREQTWGVNFQRNIRRKNETSYWAPLPRQLNLFRLSLAGTLSGVEIEGTRNLQVTPYTLGEVRHDVAGRRTNYLGDGGVDVKYNFTPSLTLDGTYNTDFAQVEVDEFQVNLNRFNLFFPEKRPFFLENAGIFSVGSPGEVELFFSRRIGIGPEGEVIPIIGGGRLSGKLGDSYNVGVLDMQTQGVGGVAPSNNFTVLRLNREFRNRSSFGGMFVNRQATGDLAGPDDHNRSYAVDGTWGVGEYGEVSGFLAKTSTPGLSENDRAFKIGSRYDSQKWLFEANYTEVGEDFNPEVGFLERESFRKVDWTILRRIRPADTWGLLELRPHASYQGFWNFEGFQETGRLHVDNHFEWRSGAEVHTGINFTKEGVVDPFEIYPGVVVPQGTYDHVEAQLVALSNQGAPVSVRFSTHFGGFFGGDRVQMEPTLRLRVGERFNTEFSWDRNDINLPWGEFDVNLARARLSYSFTPRMFVQTLIQYDDRAEIWSANVRFAWLQAANTGLFVVYNDTRGILDYDFPGQRSLIVKYSLLLDLLD